MASTSSPSIRSESERVHERPVMPLEIFDAAMKGDRNVLIRRLGLQMEEEPKIQKDGYSGHESTKDHSFGPELIHLTQRTSSFATKSNVTIEASDSAPQQINTEHQTVQSELQSATRFGDTVLHLLINNRHNELALKVFERDMSLLKAQNKMLETPLYCAAKIRNNEVIEKLIRINSLVVKDALNETNQNGDTAMHIAVKNGCEDVVRELVTLEPEVAYKVNNKTLTPFYMAIVNIKHNMVLTMLQVDRTLACTQFSDGMFPVHVAASVGYGRLVKHFFSEYPDYAELLDPRGRNFFHFAAEQGYGIIIGAVFEITSVGVIARMYDARDYEGNTPEDIARMKGNKSIVGMIGCLGKTIQNNQDLTPDELSSRMRQLIVEKNMRERTIVLSLDKIETVNDEDKKRWEKIQVTGLGSVLITTVAFAASFTVPGGYNQDNGTPILGKRYMFWAYILANAFAFIQGFISLFALLLNALIPMTPKVIGFAVIFFLLAASSMVVAFGVGLYVTLAPVCLPIAILLLVITLFLASPALLLVLIRDKYIEMFVRISDRKRTIVAGYMVPFVLIFSLALLSLLYSLSL